MVSFLVTLGPVEYEKESQDSRHPHCFIKWTDDIVIREGTVAEIANVKCARRSLHTFAWDTIWEEKCLPLLQQHISICCFGHAGFAGSPPFILRPPCHCEPIQTLFFRVTFDAFWFPRSFWLWTRLLLHLLFPCLTSFQMQVGVSGGFFHNSCASVHSWPILSWHSWTFCSFVSVPLGRRDTENFPRLYLLEWDSAQHQCRSAKEVKTKTE